MHTTHNSSAAYILLYNLIMECIWSDLGWLESITMVLAYLYVPLNTGRGIGTEACEVDSVHMFPPNDLWFVQDINTDCKVAYNFYLDL